MESLKEKLAHTEERTVLAEGHANKALESASDATTKLATAEQEIEEFDELLIEFFAQVIRTQDISWIKNYLTTLVDIWDQIVESEKQRLQVKAIDEDQLMRTYLKGEEPEWVAEGRRLIKESIEEKRHKLKGKNKVEEDSGSVMEFKAAGVEEYNPDDPLISGIPVPPPTEVFITASDEQSAEGAKPSEGIGKEQIETEAVEKAIISPSTYIPKDAEIIGALKNTDGDDGDGEEDVAITGGTKEDDSMTLAEIKAKNDELLKVKAEEEPLNIPPLAVAAPGSGLVIKFSMSITTQLASQSSDAPQDPPSEKKKRKKHGISDASKEDPKKQNKEKKSKSSPKPK